MFANTIAAPWWPKKTTDKVFVKNLYMDSPQILHNARPQGLRHHLFFKNKLPVLRVYFSNRALKNAVVKSINTFITCFIALAVC